ncbi:MAG: DMT family transporter [Thermoleophilia bacterium]|nr:DMT family transporter [Thermoleophilia bacterium]
MSDETRPVLLAAAGAACIAFSGILVRLADVAPATAAVFRCAYALPPLALLALWERRRFGPRASGQRALALVAGAFFAIDLELWHHSIAAVGAGLATVLGNVQVVLVPLAALLVLGERPHAHVFASVPVVMAGVVLISGVVGGDAYGEDPVLGVVFGVGTAVAYSVFLLVLRAGNRDLRRPAGPLFDATLASAVAGTLIGWPLGELDLVPSWPAHGWLLALALSSQALGWLLISISLPRVPAALTSVVLTLQPVMAVLLAMLLLAEAPSTVQLAGVAVVLAGIVLATVGQSRRPAARSRPAPDLT